MSKQAPLTCPIPKSSHNVRNRAFSIHSLVPVLMSQREKLEKQGIRLDAMLDLIDRTVLAIEEGEQMKPEEMLGIFGDFDPSQFDEEVEARWGHTQAYKESTRRTKGYTKVDWERIRDESQAVTQRMLAAFDQSVFPTASEAMSIAEEARLAIDRTFYPCSHEMHATLAKGYLTDERFRSFYDNQREGLAAWFASAIRANASRSTPK